MVSQRVAGLDYMLEILEQRQFGFLIFLAVLQATYVEAGRCSLWPGTQIGC